MTDRIRDKMGQLRAEADSAVARADEAEAKNKQLLQQLLEKDHEITSLQVKLEKLDSDLAKAESIIQDSKADREVGEMSKMTNEGLVRKIQLLEEELDAAEKNVKETVEKLRQVDVKAEHFERQVQRVEQERDQWEKKYEDSQAKYQASKAELDELVHTMEGL
ncbi:tropomyosin [Mycena filopes]|nr:tropomyosin [Mycena filopes]